MPKWYETNDAEQGDYSLLPIDNYDFEITKAELMQSKSGKLMAKCEFTVKAGCELDGRKVWANLMLEGAGTFKVAALISAVSNARKIFDLDGKLVDVEEGNKLVMMNYGGGVESLKQTLKTMETDASDFPILTPENEQAWGEIMGIVVNKNIQAAVDHEDKNDGYGAKAIIARFAPVNEKTLDKWRAKAKQTTGTQFEPATPDIGDGDLPF